MNAALVERSLAHLNQEERHLEQVDAVLRAMHAAVAHGQWSDLSVLLGSQSELSEQAARLRIDRAQWRRELAAGLGVKEAAVSVRALATSHGELRDIGERIRSKAAATRELSQRHGRLAQHMLGFLQSFFVELAGGHPENRSYGPTGAIKPGACGSLIEVNG